MADLRVELDQEAVRALMKSEEMMAVLESEAKKIVDRLDGDYEMSPYVGKARANVSIYTTDAKTYFKNLRNNSILKAMGG